ncbi:hypothetical protein L6164_025584 [Bauhinia variegata]|uniref:Uncharacterized protein n=1 Tax=Bauhinia variegata TaxID=167791 RepID=A0ACB9M0Y7_BAUVA|nr:hypothetical protein L6164_025584 [Bauhinia variegata]
MSPFTTVLLLLLCARRREHDRDPTPRAEASPQSPILPEELIIEILSWLPVKALLQLKRVCKSWRSLISDPQFVKKHLHRSITDARFSRRRFLLLTASSQRQLLSGSVQGLFENPSAISVDASFEFKCKYEIVGSCDGLLCLADYAKGHLRIWNPFTRLRSKKLPCFHDSNHDPCCITVFGFGFDHFTDNYKVVVINYYIDREESIVKVYNFGANSWRQIQNFPNVPLAYHGPGKFVSRTLNWAVAGINNSGFPLGIGPLQQLEIVSLDLGKETYSKLQLPDIEDKELVFGWPMLSVLKDCLCFFYDYKESYLVLWLMKEHGVRESWTKLMTIPYMGLERINKFPFLSPLFLSDNGEVLLQNHSDELVMYDPRDKKFEHAKIEVDKPWVDSMIYVESLVSPPC